METRYDVQTSRGFESLIFRLERMVAVHQPASNTGVRVTPAGSTPVRSAGREHVQVNAAGSYPVEQGSNPWRPTLRGVCAGSAGGPPKAIVAGSTPARRTCEGSVGA